DLGPRGTTGPAGRPAGLRRQAPPAHLPALLGLLAGLRAGAPVPAGVPTAGAGETDRPPVPAAAAAAAAGRLPPPVEEPVPGAELDAGLRADVLPDLRRLLPGAPALLPGAADGL